MIKSNNNAKVFTPEQMAAVEKDQGSIIVSAAAGSGKTTVLTERLLKKIDDGKDIRRYVVVTFTKTAAAEMKARLVSKLNEKIKKGSSEKQHMYKKQLTRLSDAHISTIDSFCLDLISKYRSSVSDDGLVSIGAKIGYEDECALLLQKAINDAFEEAYSTDDPILNNLLDIVNGGRTDDDILKSNIETLYKALRNNINANKWKASCIEAYGESYGNVDTNIWFTFLYDKVYEIAAHFNKVLMSLYPEPDDKSKAYKKCHDVFSELNEYSEKLVNAAKNHDFNQCFNLISSYPSISIGRVTPESEYSDWCGMVSGTKSKFKDKIDDLKKKWLISDPDYLTEEGAKLQPAIIKMFELVSAVDKKYTKLKKDKNVCDFTDIEMQVFHMLWDTDENGDLYRTDLSREIGKSYDEILVDEYQDVNELQDCIFRGISSAQEDNIFMVGDVKQCIYRFRGSDPSLFIKHREDFNEYHIDGEEIYPMNIALNGNFRSRKCITDSVNCLFKEIMKKETCGMNYLKNDELDPQAKYTDNELSGSYFTLLEKSDEDASLINEAKYVASKIKQLFADGFIVSEKDAERPIEYKDIAVLLRTSKGKADVFATTLLNEGIPAINISEDGYMNSVSVNRMFAVLQAIDNPMIDINLVTAMKSAVFGFNESELMEIRELKSGVFYYAIKEAANNGNKKAADFLKQLEMFREKAGVLTADKLIWYIYKKTGYLTYVGSLPDGKHERACLMRLYEKAKSFGNIGRQDLSGFVVYLKKIIAQKIDSKSTAVASSNNEVKVINVHKSKGLEYPVCFICDIFKKFNTNDTTDNMLVDSEIGIALKMSLPESHRIKNTLPQAVLKDKINKDIRAEEMRLLYVAMTRAREYLEIVGTVKDLNKYKENLQKKALGGEMTPFDVASAATWGDWIAPIAMRSCSFVSRTVSSLEKTETHKDNRSSVKCDSGLVDAIYNSMKSEYKYNSEIKVPNAMSVSKLLNLKNADKFDEETCCQRKPLSCYPGMIVGTEAGTAMHEFLHYVDFNVINEPEKEIERMVEKRFITDYQGKIISRRKLDNVIHSDIIKRISASEDVKREFVFDIEVPAKDYIDNAPDDEKILIRGAIDCAFKDENGKYVIVDYKTDTITNLKEKINNYKPQVEMYAKAFTEVTGCEVSEGLIYFLDIDKCVTVL